MADQQIINLVTSAAANAERAANTVDQILTTLAESGGQGVDIATAVAEHNNAPEAHSGAIAAAVAGHNSDQNAHPDFRLFSNKVAGLVPPAAAGADNRFLSPSAQWVHGTTREILTSNKRLYVRTDGNDGNDGSADDAAHAFRTINAAIDYAYQHYTTTTRGFYGVTVIVGPGEFSCTIGNGSACSFEFGITGAGKDTTTITLNTNSKILNIEGNPRFKLSNLKLISELTGSNTLWQGRTGTTTIISNVAFDVTASGQNLFDAYVPSTFLWLTRENSINITGNASRVFSLYNSSAFIQGSLEINGSFTRFVAATNASLFNSLAAYSGLATGKRYECNSGSVLNVGGKGPDYLPGSEPGTVDETSHYI